MLKLLALLIFVFTIPAYAIDVYTAVGFRKADTSRMEGSAVKLAEDYYVSACHNFADRDEGWLETPSKMIRFFQIAMNSKRDLCFLGEKKDWSVAIREPRLGETIFVQGLLNGKAYRSEGKVTSVTSDSIYVNAPWTIGISGGAIVGEDGALLGITLYMAHDGSYYVGTKINASYEANAKRTRVKYINFENIELYTQKEVSNKSAPL